MFPRYLLENKSDHLRAELRRAPLSKRVAVGSLKEGHVVFEQQKAPEKKKKQSTAGTSKKLDGFRVWVDVFFRNSRGPFLGSMFVCRGVWIVEYWGRITNEYPRIVPSLKLTALS